MALDIWAGPQADRLDVEGLVQAHIDNGLELRVAGGPLAGHLVNLDADAGDPRGTVTEILRLAAIGGYFVTNGASPDHAHWLAQRARARDAELVLRIEGPPRQPPGPAEPEALD